MPAVEVDATLRKIEALKKLAKKSPRSKTASTGSSASSASEADSLISTDSQAEGFPTESFYLWGCKLTRKSPEYVLPFPTADADDGTECHTITIKSAALGVDVDTEEKVRNVVEIRYFDREEKEARAVLASLTVGTMDFARLDMRTSWMPGHDVTLKLIKGSGPVSILGNHVVETLVGAPDEEFLPDTSSADTDTEASGMETEGDEVEAGEVEDITKEANDAAKADGKVAEEAMDDGVGAKRASRSKN